MARRVVDVEPKKASAGEGPTITPASLTAKERVTKDPAALVAMLAAHASALMDDRQQELALRKATRAHAMAQELADPALILTALRVRVRTVRGVAGREVLADALTKELLKLLEGLPEDTRRERAALLETLGGGPWWIERRPSLESAAYEANVQRALGLYRAIGEGAEADIVRTLTLLRTSLEGRRDIEARARLFAEVHKWPADLKERLRAAGLDFPQ